MGAPQIGVLVGLGDGRYKPAPFKTYAMSALLKLALSKRITVEQLNQDDTSIASKIGKFDAIITRPNWGSFISEELAANLKKSCLIATLSAGTEHIKTGGLIPNERLISSNANADATAEFTVWMAITLMRRVHFKLMEMAFGHQRGREYENDGTLEGRSWSILGRGHVAKRLLVRLPGLGISRIILCNRKMDAQIFSEEVVKLRLDVNSIRTNENGNPSISIQEIGREHRCEIEGTSDFHWAISQGDLISVHVKYVDAALADGGTHGLIGPGNIARLKQGAILLNMARAECLDEDACFLESMRGGHLAGLGTDVLPKKIEVSGRPDQSLLWQGYAYSMLTAASASWISHSGSDGSSRAIGKIKRKLCPQSDLLETFSRGFDLGATSIGGIPNVLVSQHIAGAAADAEEAVARQVVSTLLKGLEVSLPAELQNH